MFNNINTTYVGLPAWIAVLPAPAPVPVSGVAPTARAILGVGPRSVIVAATLLAAAAAMLLPRIRFDTHPLHLSDPNSEAVQVAEELYEADNTSPWTISVLSPGRSDAEATIEKLKALPEVGQVRWLNTFVPQNMDEKAEIIADMALFMPPVSATLKPPATPFLAIQPAVESLLQGLREALSNDAALGLAQADLANALEQWLSYAAARPDPDEAAATLERALLTNLSIVLHNLQLSLRAEPYDLDGLDPSLLRRYLSDSGVLRLEVVPSGDIQNNQVLKAFVKAVQRVAPDATGPPVVTVETARLIIHAFRTATLISVGLISLLLWALLRDVADAAAVLIPMLVSMTLTGAATVLLHVPFNYANIIVIPLLLGVGVDYGIHVVERWREDPEGQVAPLSTSTARAILFSALTTIMSFASLSFMGHRGTASMGILLTISMASTLFATLVVLPALLRLFHPRGTALAHNPPLE
jgi:hopanoid biosynthesis associated RND transporter like protein HpnN